MQIVEHVGEIRVFLIPRGRACRNRGRAAELADRGAALNVGGETAGAGCRKGDMKCHDASEGCEPLNVCALGKCREKEYQKIHAIFLSARSGACRQIVEHVGKQWTLSANSASYGLCRQNVEHVYQKLAACSEKHCIITVTSPRGPELCRGNKSPGCTTVHVTALSLVQFRS
jgi:hypothetical protein